jgi:hypothetical protein
MTYRLGRPRGRPRKRSWCFRSVWWLVEREAAWQILCQHQEGRMPFYTRRGFAMARRYMVRRLANSMLSYHPERRYVK